VHEGEPTAVVKLRQKVKEHISCDQPTILLIVLVLVLVIVLVLVLVLFIRYFWPAPYSFVFPTRLPPSTILVTSLLFVALLVFCDCHQPHLQRHQP
jgi:hypothetical protein